MRWWVLLAGLAPGAAWAGEGSTSGGPASLLAPVVAIGLALLTRRVVPSLLAGAAVGALVAAELQPLAALALLLGFVQGVVLDGDNLAISAFSLLVAGMVGLISANGGMAGLMARVERLASGRRGAMTASWASGGLVFFDDYANCLVVGHAMRPLCDRSGVSRAKLAYIVDSTAAPLASLAVISTWVAYQVGLVQSALEGMERSESAFALFLHSIPYGFYGLFTLAFVGAVALTGRDYGPMRAAEREAVVAPVPDRPADAVPRASPWLAAIPVVVLVGATFALLVWGGWTALGEAAREAPLFALVGEADPFRAMLGGSALALAVAWGLTLAARALGPVQAARSTLGGMRAILGALLVLYLAWTIGAAIEATGAGPWLASALDGRVAPALVPTLIFGLAAAVAFSTGSSFSTMAILVPLAVPLAFQAAGGEAGPLVYASVAAVLAGAVLGDHASPISDTTVLSSLAAGVDVVTHTRTQLPYALTTGALAVLVGFLPVGLGAPVWVLLPLGIAASVGAVALLGRPVAAPSPVGGVAAAHRR